MATVTTTVTSTFATGKIQVRTTTESTAEPTTVPPAGRPPPPHPSHQSDRPLPLPSIILYELGQTRSARVRWTLQECRLDFKAVEARPHTQEVLALNPSGKLPVLLVNGVPLTESAAICAYLADLAAKHNVASLIAPSGAYNRAQHDQWVSFAISELDTWKWHSFKHSNLPKKLQSELVLKENDKQWIASARVLEEHLCTNNYLVGNKFSVTDIVVAWSVNWGRRSGLTTAFPALRRWLLKLLQRPHCAAARHDENTPKQIYHLVQMSAWEAAMRAGKAYLPPTYAKDGFIHAAGDPRHLIAVLNQFYADVKGDFLCLELDTSILTSPVQMEAAGKSRGPDAAAKLPRIYGCIEPLSCIRRKLIVQRASNGAFVSIDGLAVASTASKKALSNVSSAAYSPRNEELRHRSTTGAEAERGEGNPFGDDRNASNPFRI